MLVYAAKREGWFNCEKNVGSIVEGTSYNLIAVRVCPFKGVNYLLITSESEIL